MPGMDPIPVSLLPQATPGDIDARLADIWGRYYALQDQVTLARRYAKDYRDRLEQAAVGTYRWNYSDDDRQRDERGLAKQEAKIAELHTDGQAVMAEADPYEAEFTRRGGWTRAWLVTNSGGHVHSSMSCSTCFPTTRFVWLTQLSGHDEGEIVTLAGEAACTVCYPSAPVDVLARPTQIVDPTVAAARAERAAAKAARDAAKAAKAIANPDGTPLRTSRGVVATERTAQLEYVERGVDLRGMDAYGYGEHMRAQYQDDMAVLLAALAHKRGTSVAEQEKLLAVKIDQKWKRDNR